MVRGSILLMVLCASFFLHHVHFSPLLLCFLSLCLLPIYLSSYALVQLLLVVSLSMNMANI